MIRCPLWWKTRSSTGAMSFSEVVKPGTSALVESVRNRSTPASPSRANARRSVIRPSRGSWSILKSPVCRTVPAPVRIATARASGMEWLTATNSSSNGPKVICSPSATTCCTVFFSRCSRSLEPTSARVSCEPTSGMSSRSRSRYGTAPMWSSWPWVSTTASTASSRSRIQSKSGRIRSTPGWFSSGKSTPQSTTSSRPSYSKTVMLRPTSPSPPSAVTRRPPRASGPGTDSSGCGWLMRAGHAGRRGPPGAQRSPRRRRAARADRGRCGCPGRRQLQGCLRRGGAVVRHAHDRVEGRQQPREGVERARRGRPSRKASIIAAQLASRRRGRRRTPARSRRAPGSPASRASSPEYTA